MSLNIIMWYHYFISLYHFTTKIYVFEDILKALGITDYEVEESTDYSPRRMYEDYLEEYERLDGLYDWEEDEEDESHDW